MPRCFLPTELRSSAQIDFDASDLTRVVAIDEYQGGFCVALTVFDFSFDFDHRANKRTNNQRSHKTRVEGFLMNVLQLGSKFREVSEEEYSLIYQTLEAKARHTKTQKKRKLMLTESNEDDHKSKLPSSACSSRARLFTARRRASCQASFTVSARARARLTPRYDVSANARARRNLSTRARARTTPTDDSPAPARWVEAARTRHR